jgi:hypothetical protein
LSAKGKSLTDPILVENVFGSYESMRLYDTSFIQRGKKIYYFKRIYKSNQDSWDGVSDDEADDKSEIDYKSEMNSNLGGGIGRNPSVRKADKQRER